MSDPSAPENQTTAASRVLDGIRVLDFGRYIAGPFCAALLGDMGAEVIRIEKVRGSEDRWVAPVTETGEGGLFLQMNRNKKSVTLNPMKPEGREITKKLIATADVVVANLPPQTLEAMGLDLASLHSVKPDVILTTVSAYGRGGPYSDRVGFDGIGQVMSSAVYMGGDEGEPKRAAVAWVDFGTALSCAFGTMGALMHRLKTGQAQQVEGSLLHTAITFTNAALIEQAVIQRNRKPTGNLGQTSAPSDLYQTKNGWILCQVIGQPLFDRWANLMIADGNEGEVDWLADERFTDDLARGDNGPVISERMGRWTASRTTEEALEILGEARIPAGPVYSMQETLDDPHIQEVGFFQYLDYPGAPRPAPVSRTQVLLSETPARINRRAPTLGEHTDEVLGALGYDQATLDDLRTKRVI